MFGLEHCVYYRCIMNGSNSILETDRSPHHLCPVCLRKLARAARFDLVDRYEKLGLIYEKLDLAGEAAFVRSRIAGL
jgi:archaemetzincin